MIFQIWPYVHVRKNSLRAWSDLTTGTWAGPIPSPMGLTGRILGQWDAQDSSKKGCFATILSHIRTVQNFLIYITVLN